MRRREFLRAAGSALGLSAITGRVIARQQRRLPMPDVVVLLPGIMGSVLQKDGKDVWAVSGRAAFSALRTLGGNLKVLKLSGDSAVDEDLGDGVTATRLIDDVHLLPGFWKIDGYSQISRFVRDQFDVTADQNFFEFPYDWRRDNRASARRLAKRSRDWLTSWRERSGNRNAKLVFIAHSMGGLVARYFIECLGGWRDTRRLVTFGTPYRGSVNALSTLVNGVKAGPVSGTLSELARSFTSIYQLLPRYPCYETESRTLVRVGEVANIPNVDARRASEALAFHKEIDVCVDDNSLQRAYRDGFWIYPIVGTFQRTLQRARRVGNGVEMLSTYPNQNWDGDGTVPEVSAVPIELSNANREMYVSQLHASLQNTPGVHVQLAKVLSRPDDGEWRALRSVEGTGPPSLSLEVEDLYSTAKPVTIRGRSSRSKIALTVSIDPGGEPGVPISRTLISGDDGAFEATVPPLTEGVYRVSVAGAGVPVSVTDVFMVDGTA